MKFGKLLAGVVEVMPVEYRKMFLNYKLFKRYIFLNKRRACLCSVKRQLEGLTEVFRHPALQGRPCQLCGRPVYFIDRDDQCRSTVYHGDGDSDAIINVELQARAFKNLLEGEFIKINSFFTTSMQDCFDKMTDLDLRRRKEESKQNILHAGGRRFWGLKKLLSLRRSMVTLSEKMVLLETYSFLNHAACLKILKKRDRITGFNIRREYVESVLERQDFFLFVPELNHHHDRCLSLLDRFPRPQTRARKTHRRAATTALHHARTFPLIGRPFATAAIGEEGGVWTESDSSLSESRNQLTYRHLVQTRTVRGSQCVYARAVEVAIDTIAQIETGVSSTHNSESLYPPNV